MIQCEMLETKSFIIDFNLAFHDNLTQKFITSYKIDPKIYFPAEKVPSKNGTSHIPIYGSYPPDIRIAPICHQR